MSLSEGEPTTLLVVDDDRELLDTAEAYIETNHDVEVLTAATASEALDLVDDADCVVSDYEMPEMDGLELLERVRSRRPEMPFLLYTGRGSEEVASEAISAGVTDYVRKGGKEKLDRLVEHAKEAKREREAHRFRRQTKQEPFEVLERISDAVYALDDDWRFTYLNGAAAEFFDASPEELVGENIWEVAPEAEETEFYDAYHEAMEEGEPRAVEAPFEPWGRWYSERLYPTDDGLTVVSRDVTERKRREEELREKERRYEAFFNDPNILAAVLDADGRLEEINRPAMEYVDVEREDVLGRPFWEGPWWNGDGSGELVKEWMEEAAEGSYVEYEVEHGGERSKSYVSEGVVRPVEDDGGDVRSLVVSARDVTRERRYRDSLEGLNDDARRIVSAEEEQETGEVVVDVALDVVDVSSTAFYTLDEREVRLVPEACSPDVEADDLPTYEPGGGRLWQVFGGDDAGAVDRCPGEDGVFGGDGESLAVSVGGYGVLVVSCDSGCFDDLTLDLLETLAMTAEAAFSRAEKTELLKEAREESRRRAERLSRVNRLNDELRRVVRSTVEARDARETREEACRAAVEIEDVEFAWILERDLSEEGLSVEVSAGHGGSFLDGERAVFPDGPENRALESGEVTVEEVLGSRAPHSDWANRALIRGFREAIAVPLEHEGLVYGVLGVYSSEEDVLDDDTAEVLADLGELVGYALHSREQRNSVFGEGGVELVFDCLLEDDLMEELSTSTSSEVCLENLVDRAEGGYLLQLAVDDAGEDDVLEVSRELPGLEVVDVDSSDGGCRLDAVVGRDELAPRLARLGADLRGLRVADDRCRVAVSASLAADRRRIVDRVKDVFPEADLVAHRRFDVDGSADVAEADLTERQHEVLRTAYHSGYFDRDRKVTGSDVAARLGVSQPSFSKQLRDAQRKLLDGLVDDGTDASLVDGDGSLNR